MRFFSLICVVILLVLSMSCIQTDQLMSSPLEPDLQAGKNGQSYTEYCRANMRTIAGQQTIYFAGHSSYATTLEQLGMAGLTCAECGLEYMLTGTDTSYSVFCPSPLDPNHGNIVDGIVSWTYPPSYECHGNMLQLISAQANYYTQYGRYADSIEELGQSYKQCPECNLPYIVTGSETEYTIECPLPSLPNHGKIRNGVPSWFIPDHDNCRANMRLIAGQETIYFAGNNCYTSSLEDLGLAGMFCFECKLTYILTATDSTYAVYCPSPLDPNHGNIIDGVPSWHSPY